MQKKLISSINGPVVEAKGEGDFAMHDMVYVGKEKLIGEVIKLNNDIATIQVYEETSGLKIGEEAIGTEAPLSITLGPGIIGNVFDGIERPLSALEEKTGAFLTRGAVIDSIDFEKQWHFKPLIKLGEKVSLNTIVGEVQETEVIANRIMNPHKIEGQVSYIADEGDYKAKDVIAKAICKGKEYEILY